MTETRDNVLEVEWTGYRPSQQLIETLREYAQEAAPYIKAGGAIIGHLEIVLSKAAHAAIQEERKRCATIIYNHQIAFTSDACGWALDKIKDGLPADAVRVAK